MQDYINMIKLLDQIRQDHHAEPNILVRPQFDLFPLQQSPGAQEHVPHTGP